MYTIIVGEKPTGFMPIWETFSDVSPRKLDGFGQNLTEGWGMGNRFRSHRERGKIPIRSSAAFNLSAAVVLHCCAFTAGCKRAPAKCAFSDCTKLLIYRNNNWNDNAITVRTQHRPVTVCDWWERATIASDLVPWRHRRKWRRERCFVWRRATVWRTTRTGTNTQTPANRTCLLANVQHRLGRVSIFFKAVRTSAIQLQYNYNKITQKLCCIAAVRTSAIQMQYNFLQLLQVACKFSATCRKLVLQRCILVLQLYCSCIALVRTT